MSVYPIKYKVLNKETGRKVTATRWRVQIRLNGEKVNKLFEDEAEARSYDERETKRIKSGIPMDKMLDLKYQAEMPEIRTLLKDYFNQYMSSSLPTPSRLTRTVASPLSLLCRST